MGPPSPYLTVNSEINLPAWHCSGNQQESPQGLCKGFEGRSPQAVKQYFCQLAFILTHFISREWGLLRDNLQMTKYIHNKGEGKILASEFPSSLRQVTKKPVESGRVGQRAHQTHGCGAAGRRFMYHTQATWTWTWPWGDLHRSHSELCFMYCSSSAKMWVQAQWHAC